MATPGSLRIEIRDNWISRDYEYDLAQIFDFHTHRFPAFQFEETKQFLVSSSFSDEVNIRIESPDGSYVSIVEQKIFEIVKSSEEGYVPGVYRIDVQYLSHKLKFGFEVLPSAMSTGALKSLRQSIEDVQTGLARSTLFRDQSFDIVRSDVSLRNEYERYHEIMRMKPRFVWLMDKVIEDPVVDLKRSYFVGVDERKSDRITERWQETKGKRKNDQFENETYFLNKRSVTNNDNPENRGIKQLLIVFRNELTELVNRFESKQKYFLDTIQSKKVDIEAYRQLIKSSNVPSEQKAQERQIGFAEQDIDELKLKMQSISICINNLYEFIRKCDFYRYDSWLAQIKAVNQRERLHSLPLHYRSVVRLFEKSNKSLREGKTHRLEEMTFRSTPYLFEVYNVLLVHQLLNNLGFKPQDSVLFSVRTGFIDAISESTLIYDKDQYRVELRYDTPIIRRTSHRKCDFYNLNAYHNRPDILIAIFDQKSSRLIDSFIIETKCVKRSYLFSDYEHTKYTEQFNDYLSFCYLERNNEKAVLRRGAVSKLFVVHPDENQSVLSTSYDLITYVGVNPNIAFIESSIYSLLKSTITKVIS